MPFPFSGAFTDRPHPATRLGLIPSVSISAVYLLLEIGLLARVLRGAKHLAAYRWLLWSAGLHFVSFLLLGLLSAGTQPGGTKLGLDIAAESFFVLGHLLFVLGVEALIVDWWVLRLWAAGDGIHFCRALRQGELTRRWLYTHPNKPKPRLWTAVAHILLGPATVLGMLGGVLDSTTPPESEDYKHVRGCRQASSALFLVVCLGLYRAVILARHDSWREAGRGRGEGRGANSRRDSMVEPGATSSRGRTTALLIVFITTAVTESLFRLWAASEEDGGWIHPAAILFKVVLPEWLVLGLGVGLNLDDLGDISLYRDGRIALPVGEEEDDGSAIV